MKKFICLVLILTGVIIMDTVTKAQVIITAHRGASGHAPENTMSSLKKAIEMGAEFCEIDVQETSDGVIILVHDKNYKRTCGVDKNVWETTYNETRELDCGRWFGDTFIDEPVPRLDEIIDAARGRIKLNIELKTNGHEKLLAEKVVELLLQKNFLTEVIITSFDFTLIDKVKSLNPYIKSGYIFSKVGERDVFAADIDLLSVNKSLINKEFMDKAFATGKEVHVWTVNEISEMEKLVELGVTSIITNYPDRLKSVLEKNKK